MCRPQALWAPAVAALEPRGRGRQILCLGAPHPPPSFLPQGTALAGPPSGGDCLEPAAPRQCGPVLVGCPAPSRDEPRPRWARGRSRRCPGGSRPPPPSRPSLSLRDARCLPPMGSSWPCLSRGDLTGPAPPARRSCGRPGVPGLLARTGRGRGKSWFYFGPRFVPPARSHPDPPQAVPAGDGGVCASPSLRAPQGLGC